MAGPRTGPGGCWAPRHVRLPPNPTPEFLGGWGLPALSLLSTPAGARRSPQEPGRSPAGARRTMAAASFVQEMRSMGEKLLLKLQRLPQAEPVEIVAFSVILLFTATVLLLLLTACCHCHAKRRRGKVHAQPVTPP